MPEPEFKPISTLSFFASEQVMVDAEISDKLFTFQGSIQPTDEQYLFLYDETASQKVYAPLQFNVHAPSEHTFNGKFYDLELHIVHKNENATDFSVIGVFFDR
jgi:carbonic anhydrase